MDDDLKKFVNKLKSYILKKNVPEDGDKEQNVLMAEWDIYTDYLNERFDLVPGSSPEQIEPRDSKVYKEFFKEVDKQEEKYIKQQDITILEMGENGHASKCAEEFIKNFERKDLLKPHFRETLTAFQSRTSRPSRASSSSRRDRGGSRKSKKEKEIKIYKRLLKKKNLTKKEDSQLKRLMKRKYCSCLTKVKRSKKVKKGIEYPICISSIYTKRNKKTPKNPRKICK